MSGSLRVWATLAAKLAITFGLLAWLSFQIDWTELLSLIKAIPILSVVTAVALLFSTILPVARRWHLVVKALGGNISFLLSTRMILMMAFLNQCVPSNLGGDVYRIIATSRTGMPWKRASLAAIVDRLIALLALSLVAFAGIMALLDYAELEIPRLFAMAGICLIVGGALIGFIFFRSDLASRLSERSDLLRRLMSALSTLLNQPAEAMYLLALSILVQCITIAAMGFMATQAGVDVPLWPMLGVCALGLLIARLPVSYGGWGVREGALVLGFAPFGVSREAALAASITYGLTELATAVLGGLMWAAVTVILDAKAATKDPAS